MLKRLKIICFVFFIFSGYTIFSQKETINWYFGNQAGLNFGTSPPTVLTNGMTNLTGGTGTISDANGNLLFYTNGNTVWDKTHTAMANGTGLLGVTGAGQGTLIVKRPGSNNLYYIFSPNGTFNFYYSIVDMSLAAGNGSVTVKNVVITTATTGGGKIAGTKHCNGVDTWIVSQDWNSLSQNTNIFRAYLLTATGVNTTAVVSTFTNISSVNNWNGSMKFSPNGKRLGVANYGSLTYDNFTLYDFDNTTGVISNSLSLWSGAIPLGTGWGWGCEFSPDGTKFYGTRYNIGGGLYQWNLCAGSPTAIVASQTLIAAPANIQLFNLQVALDGKIYVSRYNQQVLGVINNPNALGTACNYVDLGQSIAPKSTWYGFPNFVSNYFVQRPIPSPFTNTVSNTYGCQSALFNTTYNPSITTVGCSSSGYSLTGLQWNFGDPLSGASNTSTLISPIHAFTTLGTYSVNLVLYYSCGGGTDTLKQTVNINQPCISVNSTSITCAHLGSATVAATGGIGPFSYTWMPTGQTNSVATGLSPGTYTLTVFDFGNNFTYTATTHFTSLIPLTGTLTNSGNITCNGASTGTANITNVTGGSGSQNYYWFSSLSSYNTPSVSSLSAGVWSVQVSDALTGCQINETFTITQPPPLQITLSSSSPSACAGTSVTLNNVSSGGTPYLSGPSYTYSWTSAATTSTLAASQIVSGTHIYSLTVKDSLHCSIIGTIGINFVPNPTLSVSNASICPLETGTLNVTGAGTYTWMTLTPLSLTGSVFTDSPLFSRQYTVVGSALSCTTSATANIILKTIPFPVFNNNSPVCEGRNLNLSGYGGISYLWEGPLGYSSTSQYPVISGSTPNNSGAYNLTVTAANGCTATITKTLTVNPTPIISTVGSTVCTNQIINLYAHSFAGASYTWTGPGAFTSYLQNPVLASPSISNSGIYSVKVASSGGCINSGTADVTVTAMPNATITSNSPLCFGSTLNFKGSGGDSYLWNGPDGFSSILQNPFIGGVTGLANGLYNLQITTGPCINNKTHTVTIFPLPTFTASSNDPCEKDPLNFILSSVSNATAYIWQGPVGFVDFNQNPVINISDIKHSGIYTITVKDANSCKNAGTLTVTVRSNPLLIPISTTVCLKQPATLSVSGADSYQWSGPDFFHSDKPAAFVANANKPTPTIYTVIGTAANQCTSVVNASITTLSLPLPSLNVFPGTKFCLNKSFTLEGSGGKNYEWQSPYKIFYPKQSVSLIAKDFQYAGTYTLIVWDEKGCSDFTTTTISLDPLPGTSFIGTIMDACIPFRSDFSYISTEINDISTTLQINNGSAITEKKFSYPFDKAGEYLISGTFINTITSCVNTATYMVHARPLPVANYTYSPERPVEGLDEVIFTNTSSCEKLNKWNWYFINNEGPVSTEKNSSHFFLNAGIFPVAMVVKNTWGCTDTMVKNIVIENDFKVYVPNVFTPNGDELNDLFLPTTTGIKFYEFSIFDRWGKKLFQTTDLHIGWDGTFKGEPCKSEVYVWRIKVSSLSGEMKELSGHVTLIK